MPKSEDSRGWFVVADVATGDFTVEGPLPDVERWKAAVQEAQASGQKVEGVFDEGTRDEAVQQAKHQYGGRELFPSGSILSLKPVMP